MTRTIVLLVAGALLSACSSMSMRSPAATAVLAPTKGNQASGTVDFTQKGDTVLVEAKVTGLTPGAAWLPHPREGQLHRSGRLQRRRALQPRRQRRTAARATARTMPGISATWKPTPTAWRSTSAEVTGISLGTGDDSIIGRAVIVHENADDLTTQPTGDAGARLACGLISKSPDKWF